MPTIYVISKCSFVCKVVLIMKLIVYRLTIVGPINEMVPSLRWSFFTALCWNSKVLLYNTNLTIHHNFHDSCRSSKVHCTYVCASVHTLCTKVSLVYIHHDPRRCHSVCSISCSPRSSRKETPSLCLERSHRK